LQELDEPVFEFDVEVRAGERQADGLLEGLAARGIKLVDQGLGGDGHRGRLRGRGAGSDRYGVVRARTLAAAHTPLSTSAGYSGHFAGRVSYPRPGYHPRVVTLS